MASALDLFHCKNKVVIVCGAPRSGTSLVAELLDWSSSLVMLHAEGVFVIEHYKSGHTAKQFMDRVLADPPLQLLKLADPLGYLARVKKYSAAKVLRMAEIHARDPHRSPLADGVMFMETLRAIIAERDSVQDMSDAVRALVAGQVASHARYQQRYLFGKLPTHSAIKVPFGEVCPGLFPAGKFIHVRRDPVGHYASVRTRRLREHRGWDMNGSIVPIAVPAIWAASETLRRRNVEKLGADRVLTVQYEDVTSDVRGTMNHVCAWLGVPLEEEHLNATKQGFPIGMNSSFDDRARAAKPGAVSSAVVSSNGLNEEEQIVVHEIASVLVTPRDVSLVAREAWKSRFSTEDDGMREQRLQVFPTIDAAIRKGATTVEKAMEGKVPKRLL